MIARPARLTGSAAGSVAIEFALIAPMLFLLLLGVLQVGLAMQAYNALRSIAADVGRLVAVENQKANPLTNEQIRLQATALAVQRPYLLSSERVTVTVADAATQRVAGARELSFRIRYVVPSFLPGIDLPEITVSHRQPLYVSAQSLMT